MSNGGLSDEQKSILDSFFIDLNQNSVNYVVLRGHRGLPESISGGDIDILVSANQFFNTKELVGKQGWEKVLNIGNIDRKDRCLYMAKKGLKNPKKAIRYLYHNRTKLLDKVMIHKESKSLRDQYKDCQFRQNGLHIHLHNHLAYTSPMNGKMARVNPKVESLMYSRKRKENSYYYPSLPDELVHLVCRGIFDKNGEFPTHYKKSIRKFLDKIDKKQKLQVQQLLSLIFFSASDMVWETIQNKEFDCLRTKLIQFENY